MPYIPFSFFSKGHSCAVKLCLQEFKITELNSHNVDWIDS